LLDSLLQEIVRNSFFTMSSIEEEDVPIGKVACLLCRGFIPYKNSDRTRFRDHMLNEHDVKYDSDVVLAASVMSQKEKAFIVKSSLQRLSEISENKIPSSGESLLPRSPKNVISRPPTFRSNQNKAPIQKIILPNARPLHPNQIHRTDNTPRPRLPNLPVQKQNEISSGPNAATRAQRMPVHAATPRTSHPQTPQLLPPNFPAHLGISISRIDQSVNCDMCQIVFPNKAALMNHTQEEHLSRFTGLAIETSGIKRQSLPEIRNQKNTNHLQNTPPTIAQPQGPNKRARTHQTPGTFGKQLPESRVKLNQQMSLELNKNLPKSAIPSRRLSVPLPNTTKSSVASTTESQQTPLPSRRVTSKQDTVIKCNTCSQFIKQSLFDNHKLTHTGVVGPENKPLKLGDICVESIDLGAPDEQSEIMKDNPSSPVKSVQCLSCDKKLVSHMALKMHMNLKHPVKAEIEDTEELLREDMDEHKKEDSQDKLRNEVESMETLELLDNLVNFLNDY